MRNCGWIGVILLLAAGQARASLVTRYVGATLNAGASDTFGLDVDLNGTTDFTFTAAYVPDPLLTVGFDTVDVPRSNSFDNALVVDATTGDGFPTASKLGIGNLVSAASTFSFPFDQSNLFFTDTIDPATGHFAGQTGYVGLKFDRGTDILYGFAQITVNALDDPVDPLGLTIGFVGYNDVAGQSAQVVPEPRRSPSPAWGASACWGQSGGGGRPEFSPGPIACGLRRGCWGPTRRGTLLRFANLLLSGLLAGRFPQWRGCGLATPASRPASLEASAEASWRAATRAAPRRPMRVSSGAGVARAEARASARASGEPGGTSQPMVPGSTSSGMPAT